MDKQTIDDLAIGYLQQLIEAEKTRLKAEKTRLKSSEDAGIELHALKSIVKKIARTIKELNDSIILVQHYLETEAAKGYAINEFFEDISDAIERLSERHELHGRILEILLLNVGQVNTRKASQNLSHELQKTRQNDERVDSLRRELRQHVRTLSRLKERMAKFGSGTASVSIENEIEDVEIKIEAIQQELDALG